MRGNKRWMGVGFMLLLTVCLAGGGCGKGTQDGMDDGRGGSEAVSDREEGGASEGRREGDGDSGVLREPTDAGGIPEPTAVSLICEQGETLEERFLVPDGYGRKKREQDTLTAFLREYPLKKAK